MEKEEEETGKISLKKEDAQSKVERQSASNCRRNGVNLEISAKGQYWLKA